MTPGGALVAVGDGGGLDATFNGNRPAQPPLLGVRPRHAAARAGRDLAPAPPDACRRQLLPRRHAREQRRRRGRSGVPRTWRSPACAPTAATTPCMGTGFSTDGVAFYAYPGMGHSDVDSEYGALRRVGDTLEDAIFYRGNVLLLSETNRHPEGNWGGADWDLGPIAPALAAIVTDRIWHEDFENDGLAEPTSIYATIPVPAGYGRYCSVRDPVSGGFGLLPQGATSDPCQVMLDSDPDLIVERAGLYSLAGPNNVLATCAGGYVGLHPGNGGAPFDAAFAAASGRTDCVFTAAPVALPVFSRPYTGNHISTQRAVVQSRPVPEADRRQRLRPDAECRPSARALHRPQGCPEVQRLGRPRRSRRHRRRRRGGGGHPGRERPRRGRGGGGQSGRGRAPLRPDVGAGGRRPPPARGLRAPLDRRRTLQRAVHHLLRPHVRHPGAARRRGGRGHGARPRSAPPARRPASTCTSRSSVTRT